MDNRAAIREFLITRRAKLRPEDTGLPDFGGIRRVPGLRREEVALLAGVSVEYYTRLERGGLAGVSDSVLDALVRALRLDGAEREHLFDLARAAGPAPKTAKRKRGQISPSLERLLDGMTGVPAFIRNGRLDILAINTLGQMLYSEAFCHPGRPVNLARFCFLDDGAHRLYPDWSVAADTAVALLHTEAGRDPSDEGLTELVGELNTKSPEFRKLWAKHDVRLHQSGYKDFRHPLVGDLHLSLDALELPAEAGLTLTAYSAEPNTPSEARMRRLAELAFERQEDDDVVGASR
ncbi:helix-turn-helix transcriptional regulator [Brevibacterium sp. SMBL_HHYL_HB1]|uniref:helix-turn-helix transcriptional regulator n=1 Tax=Brevibacterium sp. SMBL_HHYL_HB1 TaxID=2777556 RepID=UPI001BABA390|nr:helix-turn-helix transcriptional regulator [Brevibacterium sp. SMBL_HHYL_HB1]QUL79563.1 helix-turn-helix domain-containing protein [Brevibacterium sp. SMBL_HHYL_HB1]